MSFTFAIDLLFHVEIKYNLVSVLLKSNTECFKGIYGTIDSTNTGPVRGLN